MKIGKHLDGPALEALAAGAPMPEAKFHVVECDECRAKLAAMRWENALFAGELREAGERRAATVAAQPAPLPPAPLRAQTTWLGSTFSGGFAVPSAVAAVLVLGSAVALAAFLFGNRGGDETAGVKDEPNAAPDAVQVGGDGDEKKDDKKAAPRAISWKGKTAKEWLRIWTDAQKPAGDEEAGKGRIHESREALTKLGADAIPALVEAIGKDTEFKDSLCEILAAIQPRDEEVPAFLALLKHDHYAVRGSAVMALRSKAGDPRVEAALREAAKDSDRAVAEAANDVLAQVLARQNEKRQAATEFLLMANEAEVAAKYSEAVKAYSKCLDVDPNLEQAKAGLARCRKAMQDAVRAATAAEAIETTVVPREQRRAEAEKTGVKPVEPPVPTTTVAPAGNLLVFPQTFVSQASKDAALKLAKAALAEHGATVRLAEKELAAYEYAHKQGAATVLDLERARTKVAVCSARLDAAKAQLGDIEGRPVAEKGSIFMRDLRLEDALKLEAQGKWYEAASKFNECLSLDGDFAVAKEGLARCKKGMESGLKNNQAKSQDEVARLREEIEKLKQIVQEQKQAADAARDEQARMRQGMPQGKVVAVEDGGRLSISMGRKQGVQADMVFGVLRDGLPVGRVKIERVEEEQCTGKVMENSTPPGLSVQVNDEVKLPPPHPRHDTAGDEGLGMPPMLERGVPGVEGQQPRVNRPKRTDNAGEEFINPPPPPQGMEGDGQGQGDRPRFPPPPHGGEQVGQDGQGGHPKFPPPPPREGEQGQGDRPRFPPPPHGMMPPDAPKDGKGEKDRNDADEGLEF